MVSHRTSHVLKSQKTGVTLCNNGHCITTKTDKYKSIPRTTCITHQKLVKEFNSCETQCPSLIVRHILQGDTGMTF